MGCFISRLDAILHILNIAHSCVLGTAQDRVARRRHTLGVSSTVHGSHGRGFKRSVRRIPSTQKPLADGSCARAALPRDGPTGRALSVLDPRAANCPAAPDRSRPRCSSCSWCSLPRARAQVSQCSGCSVWRNVRRGPPLHDVKDIAMVLLSSGATHARRAVTPMPLAALAAPDGTWSAYTPRPDRPLMSGML